MRDWRRVVNDLNVYQDESIDLAMNKPLKIFAMAVPTIAVLSACVPTPEELETTPVKVQTPKGVVTCQLYRHDRVSWDRAIDFPATKMSVPEADNYCKQEGLRRLKR